jgi:hypothetical protein
MAYLGSSASRISIFVPFMIYKDKTFIGQQFKYGRTKNA